MSAFYAVQWLMDLEDEAGEIEVLMASFDDITTEEEAMEYMAEYAPTWLQVDGSLTGLDRAWHSDATRWFADKAEAEAVAERELGTGKYEVVEFPLLYCQNCRQDPATVLLTDFGIEDHGLAYKTTPLCESCAEVMCAVTLLNLLYVEVPA